MTTLLTDRAALIRNRLRARRAPVTLLQDLAFDEVQDRLSIVNKSFTDIAIVTGAPENWQSLLPQAKIVADEDTLDLAEASLDLVVHAMSLHWANDPVGQMIQSRRALRADGLFLGVLFGGETLHELRACLGQAEVEVSGGMSPHIAPMAEIRDLGGLLQRAGFALPVADSFPLTVSYPTPLHLMREVRRMGEGNALHSRQRKPMRRAVLERAIELYAENFGDADGRVSATFELIVLTGWAPADTQPKPLRPGSASARLADALGTDENPLRD